MGGGGSFIYFRFIILPKCLFSQCISVNSGIGKASLFI